MVKLWFKTIKDGKIVKQTVYEDIEKFEYGLFNEYVIRGCNKLDEATPIIIRNHIIEFAKFHMVTFNSSDFIDYITFDKLVVENLDRG